MKKEDESMKTNKRLPYHFADMPDLDNLILTFKLEMQSQFTEKLSCMSPEAREGGFLVVTSGT